MATSSIGQPVILDEERAKRLIEILDVVAFATVAIAVTDYTGIDLGRRLTHGRRTLPTISRLPAP